MSSSGPAWEPDALGNRGGARGMACAGDGQAWRPAGLFRCGDRRRTDTSSGSSPPPSPRTEGTMKSIVDLLGVELAIPDHTTFGRRGGGLTVLPQRVERNEPLHLLIDSTGVKIYGEGEWLDQKSGVRSRRRRCKLHLAVERRYS